MINNYLELLGELIEKIGIKNSFIKEYKWNSVVTKILLEHREKLFAQIDELYEERTKI